MGQEHEPDERLSDLERALVSLTPTEPRLNIGRTMFLAGQASVGRRPALRQLWPLVSICLAILSLTLGVVLAMQDDPRVVYVSRDSSASNGNARVAGTNGIELEPVRESEWPQTSFPLASSTPDSTVGGRRLLNRLDWRTLAQNGTWDDDFIASEQIPRVSAEMIRYRDWPSMVDHETREEMDQISAPLNPFHWSRLLPTRGS